MQRSILITGASSGIGRYATEVLANRGWIVWAGYREESIRDELLKIHPQNVHPILIEVTDIHTIYKAKELIEASGIQLNVLFNNAGIAIGGPIEVLNVEEVQKVFDVNFFGYLRMIKVFLPLLRKSHGRIINMSSLAGLVGVPFLMPYSSSKHAIEGMSDGLRRELFNQKIQVIVIEPGPIKTMIWKKALKDSSNVLEQNQVVLNHYQPTVGNFAVLLEKNEKFSVPLKKLRWAIIHSTGSPNPRLRYLVYRNNILLKTLILLTPNRFLDFLFRITLKKVDNNRENM
jgi:NAD(P)-dependent dehydrogenase (short-subunit alcohol dehydrogenase family)